jgi:hypothetical protein
MPGVSRVLPPLGLHRAAALPDLGVIVRRTLRSPNVPAGCARRGRSVNKPATREVMARIEAVVRCHRRGRLARTPGAGDLDPADRFQVYVAGGARLTAASRALQSPLITPEGPRRDEIHRRVWGTRDPRRRFVQSFAPSPAASPGWDYIHTHFGIGYRFRSRSARGTTRDRKVSKRGPRPPPANGQTTGRQGATPPGAASARWAGRHFGPPRHAFTTC